MARETRERRAEEARGDDGSLRKVARAAFWSFLVALVIQTGHFFEHVAQIHQFVWLADPRPQGLFGSVFDFAWVHFVYNAALFVAVVWCYALWMSNRSIWRPSRWGAVWFHSLVLFQGYHVVEHTAQMYQYYRYGLLVPPGIVGQFVPNIIAHFDINGIVTVQMLVVLLSFQPSPRPYGTAPAGGRGLLARLPGGFRTGVLGSGGVAAVLTALLVVFANSAPAATVVPAAKEHCLGEPKEHVERTTTDWAFADVAASAGISHVIGAGLPAQGRLGIAGTTGVGSRTETHPMKTLIGGLAVDDVDGDGWTDFVLVDHDRIGLYRNRGDGSFEEVAERAGLEPPAAGRAPLLFDADDDGDPDLLVTMLDASTRFWRNEGGLRFVDATEASGLGFRSTPHMAAAVDVDGDGDLDVSVANYGPWFDHNPETQATAENGDRDLLFINAGNGTFTEESAARGIDESRWTFSHAWGDADADGDLDLYTNNDFGWDQYWENDGTGRFVERSADVGLLTDGNGMGAVWVDHDGDRDLDLYVSNIYVACNRDVPQFRGNDLFLNRGDGTFEDVAEAAGIADGAWAWDAEWVDFDHDGDLDAYQANGYSTRGKVDRYHDALTYLSDDAPKQLRDRNQGEQPSLAFTKYNRTKYVIWSFYPPLAKTEVDDSSQGGHQVDRLWLNDGGRFRDAGPSVGFSTWTDSRAAAAIDYDNDGDMDLLRTAWHRPVELLDSPGSLQGHWLKVTLEGTESNRDAVGARVEVRAGDLHVVRWLLPGGFLSQSEPVLHFGLGEETEIDEVFVVFPSGKEVRLTGVEIDRFLKVVEP